MLRVYGMSARADCHKVRMALEAWPRPYAWTEIDPALGGTRTPEFLAMNPNGKVPVLEIEPGTYLPDRMRSCGIWPTARRCCHPARCSARRCCSGFFFEQYSTSRTSPSRLLRKFHPDPESQRAARESKMSGGLPGARVMDERLAQEPFFVRWR